VELELAVGLVDGRERDAVNLVGEHEAVVLPATTRLWWVRPGNG